jgi:serine acetyltransferase
MEYGWHTAMAAVRDHGVGKDCRIACQVRIETRSGERLGPVVAGDGVLIGWNVLVLPNVSIGDGAKIGANAVVYRDVPAAGVVRSQMIDTPFTTDREEFPRT